MFTGGVTNTAAEGPQIAEVSNKAATSARPTVDIERFE
jgi:hypothetical protein